MRVTDITEMVRAVSGSACCGSPAAASTTAGPAPERMKAAWESNIVKKKVAVVVVLGDIARSPRMRLHAESFVAEGYYVHVVANRGSSVVPVSLSKNPSVRLTYLPSNPPLIDGLPRILAYLLKFSWQFLGLTWVFFWSTFLYALYPQCIIVQNPPALPTLPVMASYAKIFRCQLIVDWHNYGYTLLQLSAGRDSLTTKVYQWCEFYFGSMGTTHLTVTDAMKADLEQRTGVRAITYHDRPGSGFKPLRPEERTLALKKFSQRYSSLSFSPESNPDHTGILVSSTSWTEDEDFSILLKALQVYDEHAKNSEVVYPKLIVFITGKGPLKGYYRNMIQKLQLTHIEIHLPWLEHDEYPLLLACADLGVSLHTSSSGLDLPMKVVDMFGCGLPVAALNFPCIAELVHHDVNGLIFSSSDELAEKIKKWFSPVPNAVNRKKRHYRHNLKHFHTLEWHDNWREKVLPALH